MSVIGISTDEINMVIYGTSMNRYCLTNAYVNSILNFDATPILLPHIPSVEIVKKHAELIDGLFLSGGSDVSPSKYNEEINPKTVSCCISRDEYECMMINEMIKRKKPILAICRGMQVLNVACGGALHQDINDIPRGEKSIKHVQELPLCNSQHKIRINGDSLLYKIFNQASIKVNSAHHQCLSRLSFKFKAVAWSEDNLIEAIEHTEANNILGVQWHPEQMGEEMDVLFKCFVNWCER